MKKLFFFILFFAPWPFVYALDFVAPKMVNLQAILTDAGGNVLYDTQQADITFYVVDGDGTILYEEFQHVIVVKGAMSVLVGNGYVSGTYNPETKTGEKTGGIPIEAFSPDGTKILRYKLNVDTIPKEDLQIVSVPYAYYAQSALEIANPIDSSEIKDGGIEKIDFSQELLDFINNSIVGVSEQDLLDHKTEREAHPASSISVHNVFRHASGNTVQDVLSSFDSVLGVKGLKEGEIDTNLGSLRTDLTKEAQDRELEDNQLTTRLNTANTTLTDHMNATTAHGSSGAIVGQTTLDNALSDHVNTNVATAHPNGSLPTSRLSGQIATNQIDDNAITSNKIADSNVTTGDILNGTILFEDFANNLFNGWDRNEGDDFTQMQADDKYSLLAHTHTPLSLGAAPAVHNHDTDYVNATGDTMTGPLNMSNNNITNIDLVDGVNINSVTSTVGTLARMVLNQTQIDQQIAPNPNLSFNLTADGRNHENRIRNLEGKPLILASALIDAGPVPNSQAPARPIFINSSNFSSVDRLSYPSDADCCIENNAKWDAATYELIFAQPLSSANYYVSCTTDYTGVDETAFTNANNKGEQYYPFDSICTVTNRSTTSVHVQTRSSSEGAGASGVATPHVDFHIIIFGS